MVLLLLLLQDCNHYLDCGLVVFLWSYGQELEQPSQRPIPSKWCTNNSCFTFTNFKWMTSWARNKLQMIDEQSAHPILTFWIQFQKFYGLNEKEQKSRFFTSKPWDVTQVRRLFFLQYRWNNLILLHCAPNLVSFEILKILHLIFQKVLFPFDYFFINIRQ